jgi:predicted ATPase
MDIRRIVIVGGPGAGKSTILKPLTERFRGVLYPVQEAATYVIENYEFFPPFEGEELRRFQKQVAALQHLWEENGGQYVRETGMQGLLCDRGRVDGPAYLPGGLEEWEDLLATSLEAELDRYTMAIFLEMPPREQYERIRFSNPSRCEDWEEAKPLSDRILNLWELHREFCMIPYLPVPERITHVESLVRAHLDR